MIDPATLGQGAAGFGILAGGLFGGYQAWRARKGADRAAAHAYPISNGWGTAMRDDMAATRRTVERMAEAQLLAERREQGRDQALDEVRSLLQAHLMDHARESTA